MINNKKIISSFYLQDTLNPLIWEKSKKNTYILNSTVRNKLLNISNIFLDYLDVKIFVQDIILIGSLTGYNWSEFSDFDLHILYDFNEAGDKKELYKKLFRLKKTVFNSAHDIKIKGFEVEIFVQDINDSEKSAGSYSIMNNEWIRIPKKDNFKIDEIKLKEKVEQWMEIIDGVLENAEDENLEDAIRLVKKYKEKLRKYRSCGLKKEGEFSYENLVFKFLRRNGYIDRLDKFKNKISNKKLSLEQKIS
jgi:hypothetical protein